MIPGASSVSADATLRAYAPACLREPYLRASGARGLRSLRPGWTFGFAEQVARFLIALLAPEGGAQAPEVLEHLLPLSGKKLTDGALFEAAHRLAKAVDALGRDAVAAPAAAVLVRHGRRTEAGDALKRLLEARNWLGHGPTGPVTASPEAQERFADEYQHHLRVIARALGFVAARPICALDEYDPFDPEPRLLRFAGPEPVAIGLADVPAGVPVREPLLVDEHGRWITLGPFLSLTARHGGMVPRLLPIGRRQLAFQEPHGETHVEPEAKWKKRWATEVALKPPRPAGAPCPLLRGAARWQPTAPPQLGPELTPVAPIERGSSATVWLARNAAGEHRAAKVLHAQLRLSATHRRRLTREARLLQDLDHPGVVRCHGLVDHPDTGPVLLMDYLPGADIGRQFVHQRAPEPLAVQIVDGVLAALEALHARGAVHRDVKPSNVVLDGDGRPVLVDLGIAYDADASRMTATVDGLGTRRFSAPEQFNASAPVDARADLYGAGRLLAWLLGGDAALRDDGLGHLPAGLGVVVRRATRPDPADRYADVHQMRAELAAAARGATVVPLRAGDRFEHWRLTSTAERHGDVWQAGAHDTALDQAVRLWFAPLDSPGHDQLKAALRHVDRRTVLVREGSVFVETGPEVDLLTQPRAPKPEAPQAGDVGPTESALALAGYGLNAPSPPGLWDAVRLAPQLAQADPALTQALGGPQALLWPTLEALLLAAGPGRLGPDGWFAHRLDRQHARATPQARVGAVCDTLAPLPGGAALQAQWAQLVACPPEQRRRLALALIQGLRLAGRGLGPLHHAGPDGPALLWDARRARRLVDGRATALPAPERARLAHPWLRAGLMLNGLVRREARDDRAMAGYAPGGRPRALALLVDDLDGPAARKSAVIVHLRWISDYGVPLVGLSDGSGWRWLRRVGRRRLVELVGTPEAHLATTR